MRPSMHEKGWYGGYGIKARYPHLPVSEKLRGYLQMARPLTWAAPLVGGVCGILMAIGHGAVGWDAVVGDWRHGAYGIGTLLMIVVGGNFVNNAHDVAADRISKAYRAIPAGIVSVDEALTLGHIVWFVALARAATMGVAFGVVCLLLVGFSYLYSTPPVRLKAHTWIGNVGIAIPRGLLGIVAAWSIYADPLTSYAPWAAGVVMMVFLIGATTSKDFNDEAGDRAQGVRTLVVAYGARKAAALSAPFALTPLVLIPVAVNRGLIDPMPLYAYAAIGLICLRFTWSLLFKHGRDARLAENTRPWVVHYEALLVLMLSFASSAWT